jgi:hypothetical protein
MIFPRFPVLVKAGRVLDLYKGPWEAVDVIDQRVDRVGIRLSTCQYQAKPFGGCPRASAPGASPSRNATAVNAATRPSCLTVIAAACQRSPWAERIRRTRRANQLAGGAQRMYEIVVYEAVAKGEAQKDSLAAYAAG